jgi:hypothetical protein
MTTDLDAIRARLEAATEDMAEHNAPHRRAMRALLEEVERLRQFEVATQEAHAVLDAASVPTAVRATCDDPNCKTMLGHRVRWAVAEIARFRAEAAKDAETIYMLRRQVTEARDKPARLRPGVE